MLKKFLIILLAVLLVAPIVFFFFYVGNFLFQEGNPLPLISGIARLNFAGQNIVKISGSGDRYMTKSKNGRDIFISMMKDKEYDFIDQFGAGYIFEKENTKITAVHRFYSKFYDIWNVSEIK